MNKFKENIRMEPTESERFEMLNIFDNWKPNLKRNHEEFEKNYKLYNYVCIEKRAGFCTYSFVHELYKRMEYCTK